MNTTEQTLKQIERAIRKAAAKCPTFDNEPTLTDIYLQVKQDSGEILVHNDDDVELTRCVVEEWISHSSDNFYEEIQPVIGGVINSMRPWLDENLNLLRPFSFVLVDEDGDIVTDLALIDDDTIVVSGDLMEGLNQDLDLFFEHLMKE